MMGIKPVHIDCPHCNGSGKRELTGVYAETLAAMRKLLRDGGFIVASQHAELFGCNATALNNRLDRLEQLGLVVSERYGRQRRFTVRKK